MKIREQIYKRLGFFIDKEETLSQYLMRLNKRGQLDEKNKMLILMALVDKVEELESK